MTTDPSGETSPLTQLQAETESYHSVRYNQTLLTQLYFFNRRSSENLVSPSCLAARLLL